GTGAYRPDDHARSCGYALLVELHQAAREGVLYLSSAPSNRDARGLRLARSLPLLRVLGSDAGADVLSDRHLGGENRLYAAIKFFLYTLVGSVVMLLAILKLYFMLPELVQAHQGDLARWLVNFAGNEKTIQLINQAAQVAGSSLPGQFHSSFNIPILHGLG